MQPAIVRAVIYARVSSDTTGHARSVTDQVAECRAECARHGWPVAEVLTDNDRGASRHSRRSRPAYDQLADILAPGDVLVTWEASRAQRDLAAYTRLRDLCASRRVLWSYSGRLYDLDRGDDRFTTGLDALLSEKEAEVIRERVLRGKRSRLEAGKPNGRMPYGYRRILDPATGRPIRWEPHPDQAPIVREIATRILDGEAVESICRDLNDRRITPPSRGGSQPPAPTWVRQRVRTMILAPSYAGLLTHRGAITGPGDWSSLISEDEHHRLVAILTDPARTTHRGCAPKHLLTGIAECGRCGSTMRFFHPASVKTGRYMCQAKSCVARRADMVDAQVTDTLLDAMARWTVPVASEGESSEITEQIRALRQRLDGFADTAAAGGITPASFARIESRLAAEIDALTARARSAVLPTTVHDLAGPGARAAWEAMGIVGRREAIRATMRVIIDPPARRGPRSYDPESVRVEFLPSLH